MQQVQNALGGLDPSALVAGFVAIVEWLEDDGSSTFSVVHSPMTAWHRDGLLHHAVTFSDEMGAYPVILEMDGDFDEDE